MSDTSRLERTDVVLCLGLLIALFAGMLALPYWGQVAWIILISAAYIRLTIVIIRRERLLSSLRDGGLSTTSSNGGQSSIGIGDGPGQDRITSRDLHAGLKSVRVTRR
jgi:hypothetical protein